MDKKKTLAIFCGSSSPRNIKYIEKAKDLGHKLVKEKNWNLVYGGASVGLMGAVSDAVLRAGGRVYGIIPKFLVSRGVQHHDLYSIEIVDSMHERKALIYDRADAFLALPGGFGTLDEIIEVTTWHQLRLHNKPCFILNLDGFYDGLLKLLNNFSKEGFIKTTDLNILQEVKTVDDFLAKL